MRAPPSQCLLVAGLSQRVVAAVIRGHEGVGTKLAQAVEQVSNRARRELERLGDGSGRLALLGALPQRPPNRQRNGSSQDRTSTRPRRTSWTLLPLL